MTPAEIEEVARSQYNAIGDTHFTSTDILNSIYHAQIQLVNAGVVIENSYTTSTVASQQEYAYPTNAVSIKRITYEGARLDPIDFQLDDTMTLNVSDTAATGTPQFYYVWDEVIYLRPIPAAVGTLKIYSFDMPSVVTATSVLDVPTKFHMDIVDYTLSIMYAKDKDVAQSRYHLEKWQGYLAEAKKWAQKRKRGNGFAVVKSDELLGSGYV